MNKELYEYTVRTQFEMINKLNDKIDNLQEEIKRQEKSQVILDNQNAELQERINKAIEYINDMCLFDDEYANYGDDLRPAHIVDILQGEDNE